MNGAVGVIYFPTHWGSDLEPQNLPNHRVARCFFFVCKNAGKQTSFLYSFFFFFFFEIIYVLPSFWLHMVSFWSCRFFSMG